MSTSRMEEKDTMPGATEEEPPLEATQRRRMAKNLSKYVKAAEKKRQAYISTSATPAVAKDNQEIIGKAAPGGKDVRQGDEVLELFPSYAKRHVKLPPRPPGPVTHVPGEFETAVQEVVVGEEDNAVVDVDVRGWIYQPHRGPLTRKFRVLIGLARKLSGIPAPDEEEEEPEKENSASAEKQRLKIEMEKEMIALAAEEIAQKGLVEEKIGKTGEYSEVPTTEKDAENGEVKAILRPKIEETLKVAAPPVVVSDADNKKLHHQARASWRKISDMTQEELREADDRLLSRLKPFTNYPIVSESVEVTFSNETNSNTQTTLTNSAGHFALRASLPFIPTDVRASCASHPNLTASNPIAITQPTGISLITDVDDTIKHSSITSGAREVFRNVFIRPLNDLTIEGVAEWYQTLYSLGVSFHYVSNSPWQLYPLLVSYFTSAGLPDGSYHLKHYKGMLQGIFEPVAERKKGTLGQLMRDFPDRRWLLVGDSGEADLEVYTDVVVENPGRVVGVFIRDVTTDAIQKVLKTGGVKDVPEGPKNVVPERSPLEVGDQSSRDPTAQKQDLTEAALKSHTTHAQHTAKPEPNSQTQNTSQSYATRASSYLTRALPTSWQPSASTTPKNSEDSTISSDDLESLAEELQTWTERWETIMDKEKVVLRKWVVGGDVMKECVDLVQRESKGEQSNGDIA